MHNTDLALDKQIISDFDGLYLKGIERRHVRFIRVPSINIIQHIYNFYDTFNEGDIDDNDTKLSKNYESTLPNEVLFGQIEEGMEVAEAASCPYNKK